MFSSALVSKGDFTGGSDAVSEQRSYVSQLQIYFPCCWQLDLWKKKGQNSKTKLNPQPVQERKTQTCCATEEVSNTNISKEESF